MFTLHPKTAQVYSISRNCMQATGRLAKAYIVWPLTGLVLCSKACHHLTGIIKLVQVFDHLPAITGVEHGVLLKASKSQSYLLPAPAQAIDGTDTQRHSIIFHTCRTMLKCKTRNSAHVDDCLASKLLFGNYTLYLHSAFTQIHWIRFTRE